MARYFLDTSALVKYYHTEEGTPAVSSLFAEPSRTVLISSLGFLEMQSAIAMKVRSGALERESAGLLRGRLMLDIAAGTIEVYSVAEDHFIAAERLLDGTPFPAACAPSTRSNSRSPSTCKVKDWWIPLSPLTRLSPKPPRAKA